MDAEKRGTPRVRVNLAIPRAVLGSPAMGQVHVLGADSICAGEPIVGEPAVDAGDGANERPVAPA